MNEEKTISERAGLRPLANCVAHQPTLCLCLACYWFWQLFYFQSPASFSVVWEGVLADGRLLLLASSCIAYIASWKAHRSLAKVAARSWYPWLVGACMAGGTLLQSAVLLLSAYRLQEAVFCVGSVAMGIGAALFIVELSRIFAQLGSRYALLAGVVGLVGSTVLFAAAVILPDVGKSALLVVAAVTALYAWRVTTYQFSSGRFYSWGLDVSLRVPLKLVFTCFIQGLALGTMTAFLSVRTAGTFHPAIYVAAFGVGALVVWSTADTLKLDFNHLLYQVGFPLMGLGFLAQACLSDNSGLPGFMFSVAHCYVYILMTCICSYFSNCLKCSPAWIVSLITLAMVGGQLAGTLGVAACEALLGETLSAAAPSVAATLAFLLPTMALLLLSNDNTVSGWGAIRPAERESGAGDAALFAKIASDYQLTTREREICEYLSRGRNKRYISEQLGVAEETVKTHMSNLYRKLLVHSQQEIIDLVERERAARDR